jgi:hypothetical protein
VEDGAGVRNNAGPENDRGEHAPKKYLTSKTGNARRHLTVEPQLTVLLIEQLLPSPSAKI